MEKAELILAHAKRIVECSPKNGVKPYMVIDDGWELCHHCDEAGGDDTGGKEWDRTRDYGINTLAFRIFGLCSVYLIVLSYNKKGIISKITF